MCDHEYDKLRYGIMMREERKMDLQQEAHLTRVKNLFTSLVDSKYRKGAEEHGGKLEEHSQLDLVNMALDEAVDQVVYLITLRDNIMLRPHRDWKQIGDFPIAIRNESTVMKDDWMPERKSLIPVFRGIPVKDLSGDEVILFEDRMKIKWGKFVNLPMEEQLNLIDKKNQFDWD